MKDTIYFADLVHNGTIKSIDTFPLGAGLIAAYALDQCEDDINYYGKCEFDSIVTPYSHVSQWGIRVKTDGV